MRTTVGEDDGGSERIVEEWSSAETQGRRKEEDVCGGCTKITLF